MSKIKITLSGVAAELALGNYMPTDSTIMNNWEDFYHYDDLIHVSQLLPDYISEIVIEQDHVEIFKGKIPAASFNVQNSFSPVLVERALYLRTECAEEAVYECEFEVEEFDKSKLVFETQDYHLLFKIGKSFLAKVLYNDVVLELVWMNAKPIGNLCLLCRFENGFMIPIYDAVNKIEAK